MSYDIEDKSRARQLFIEDGLTYDQVASETEISESQLKKWGKEGDWVAGQKEFERDYLDLSTNVHRLKIDVVKNAIRTKHSQDVIAAVNLLQAMPTGRKARRQVDKAALFIEFATGLIEYLKVKDQDALRYLEPHIRGFADSVKAA